MSNTNPEQSASVEGMLTRDERDEIFQKLMYEAGYGKIEAGIGICHCAAHELLYHMNACEQELQKAQATIAELRKHQARVNVRIHECLDWLNGVGDPLDRIKKARNAFSNAAMKASANGGTHGSSG